MYHFKKISDLKSANPTSANPNKYNELQTAWKPTGPTLWTQDKPLFSYLLVGF